MPPPPNTLRMIGAAPAVYLLVAVGVWEAFRFLRERCRALPWRASLILQENETRAAIVVGVVVGGLILVQGALTYRAYFQKWAAAPEIYEAYDVKWTKLARALNAQPPATDEVYLIPAYARDSSSAWQYSFQYLYQGATPTQMVLVGAFNLAPKIESTLASMESVSTVKFVDWDDELVGGDSNADEQIVFLLNKYGRYLSSDEYADFQIHTYTDISLERPWILYEQLEPVTVDYDGGIALQGLALGQGAEQMSSRQLLNLGHDRSLWVGLQWQTAPGWKSIMRYPYACTMLRAEESTRRMLFYGIRISRLLVAEGNPNWLMPWSYSIFRLISWRANTSCDWSSTTPRR